MYDKEFRLHMARNPMRSWSMILQQAWSLRLKDRIMSTNNWANSYPKNNAPNHQQSRSTEPCRRFNRGRCNFGANCKFEHRCSYCFKFGHGSVNCRKAQGDRENRDRRSQGGNEKMSLLYRNLPMRQELLHKTNNYL